MDDTNLSFQGKSTTEVENKINTDLENVHKWLIANKLTLSQEKTECMLVSSRQRLQQFLSNPQIVIVIQQSCRLESRDLDSSHNFSDL